MKTLVNLSLSIVLILTVFSCSKNKYRALGDWDDNIHLSTKVAEFSASGDSITITTKGSSWWITGMSMDSTNYTFRGFDLQADSFLIKENHFEVKRHNKNTLSIKVDANPQKTKRIISIEFEAGDYFDYVTITQKSN